MHIFFTCYIFRKRNLDVLLEINDTGERTMKFIARASVFIVALLLSITSFVATASTIPLKSTHNTASVYVLNTVFKNNSATIKTKYYARLDDIAAFLRTRPHMKAVIKGQPSYNHKLGQKRAKTIVTYLTEREVKRRNITTTGFNYSIHKAKPATTKNKIPLQVADNTASVHIPVGMYKYNSAAIKPKYDARLSDIAAYLRSRPDLSAVIYGYPASHRLAEKRAKNIVQYFVNRNVKSNNISTTGFGINKSTTYTKPQPVQENTFNSLHTPSGPVLETPVPAKSIPASATTYSSDNTSGYVIPHVYLSGAAGSSVLGEGKVLQPVFLRNDRNLFIYNDDRLSYGAADWENNPWSASLGMGYRQIVNNIALLGGYVLGSYNKTPTDHSIWTINPGIEALGRVWEFRANGYIPVSKKDWKTEGWADEFGNYNYISYQGHNQYDAWFTYHEEAGIGGDAEIGRTLFKVRNVLVKGYVNSYVFGMKHNDSLYGGGARVTVQPNTYLKFSVKGSYDNYAHTTVMVGVEVSLYDLFAGGSKTLNDQNLERHLFDPIENNSATLSSGSTIPTVGGPENSNPEVHPYNPNTLPGPDNGHNVPERTNVWFFNGDGSLQATTGVGDTQDLDNGTYEHPFTRAEFNQDNLAKIYQATILSGAYSNAYLYFNPGTYNAYNTNIYDTSYTHVELYEHESLWGRMGDEKGFQEPATGNNRPVFVGGFNLDSNTSVNNVILHNNHTTTGFDAGIVMNNATNVAINDSQIGVDAAGDNGYHTGVAMTDNSSLSINNSQVYGYSADTNDAGVGIKVTNGGDITATNNSEIKGYGDAIGMGIDVVADAAGNATINSVSGDGTANFIGEGNTSGYGLYAVGRNVTIDNISDSNFSGISHGLHDAEGNGIGLYAKSSATSGDATTTIDSISNSTFTGTYYNRPNDGSLWDKYYAAGLDAESQTQSGDARVIIAFLNNSIFKGQAPEYSSFGMKVAGDTTSGKSYIYIHSLANSEFLGDGVFSFGAYIPNTSQSGSVLTTIDSISNSKFIANTTQSGWGFKINSSTQSTNTASSSGIKIYDISKSLFSGTGPSDGIGFDLTNNAKAGAAYIYIDTIDNSDFEASNTNWAGFSKAYAFGASSNTSNNDGLIRIMNITNSTFKNTGVGSNSASGNNVYGFFVSSDTVDLRQVIGNTFSASSYGSFKNDVYGFSAEGGAVGIENMSGNTFDASNSNGGNMYGVWLSGKNINVAGNTDPKTIRSYIENGNTFNVSSGGKKICINLPGQTVCY